ncbi:MAG: VIT1/CCC1 transporter family protein [Planctomycetaceae bacterium]|nr:VIT1/CCC1 transporter family protein [Planctomycetaceae bacterium]
MPALPHDTSTQQGLESSHTPEQIRLRLKEGHQQSYLRDFVYGAIDGAVTTFAVVSGVAGAGLSSGIVVILGGANLIGDGFSMAAGNFLGTQAEEQLRERARQIEEKHIDRVPDGEREEIRQIFENQGFHGADLERIVEIVTSDRQLWVDTMLKEEHGLSLSPRSPWKSALATFVAFLVIGLVPLVPFLWNLALGNSLRSPYIWSTISTGIAFFSVGAIKSRFVDQSWYAAGLETLIVGGTAALLAYGCGVLLAGLG